MNTRILLPFALTLALLTGCVTGTHIITGIKRPPIKPSQVVLYQVPPAKFEIIGIVNVAAAGRTQGFMDDAIGELKKQAAKIGANGVLIGFASQGSQSTGVGFGSGYGGGTAFSGSTVMVAETGIQLSGQAIYVSP